MINKRTYIGSLLLMLFGCGGGGTSQVENISVELNGDSILFGYLLTLTPADFLKKERPNWVIKNVTAGGLTLDDYYKGYTTPYTNASPSVFPAGPQLAYKNIARTSKYIVIELGGNDAYGSISPITFENELREIISTIKLENRIPILTGIVGLVAGDTFDQNTIDRITYLNKLIRQISVDTNTPHAGWDTYSFNPVTDTIDGIHRTQPVMNNLMLQLIKTIEAN